MRRRRKKRLNANTAPLFKQIFFGFLALFLVAGLIAIIYYGTRIDSLTLKSFKVKGGETVSHDEIEEKVQKSLEGTYFGLIPKKFAWLYPQDEVIGSVSEVEKVEEVSVERISGTELNVTFTEHMPTALWCESVTSTDCVYIDTTGYGFTAAPKLEGGSFLQFVRIGKSPETGQSVLSPEEFNTINILVNELYKKDWNIHTVILDRAGDAYLQLIEGGEFKISLKQSPEETLGNLGALLASEDYAHLGDKTFIYVDLRFGNKLFIKETEVSIIPEEEPLNVIEAVTVEGDTSEPTEENIIKRVEETEEADEPEEEMSQTASST